MLLLVIVVALLAITRITRLMTTDKIMIWYRQAVVKKWGPESWPSYLAHCEWCTSMWVSLLVMPPAVIWPNRWVLAALAVPAASLVAGFILSRE